MKNMKITAAAFTALAVFTFCRIQSSHAAGFLVYDMSGEALGRAGAVSAAINSPAAIWFNPSAMSYMPGYQFTAGGVAVVSSNTFTPEGDGNSVSSETDPFFIPHLYGTFEIMDWMHAGIGVFSPFGLGVKWPEDWLGREHGIYSSLQTVIVNPALSFKVWKNVSIAAGFSLIYGAVDMKNGLPEPIGGSIRIGGSTWAVGGNAAVTWRILPELLHVALSYRSRAKLSFDGNADFDPEAEEFASNLPDQKGKSGITLPDIFTFGVMYKPISSLEITFDVNYTLWSTYDKLKLEFENEDTPNEVLRRDFQNSFTFRLGFDYTLPTNPLYGKFKGRIGFIFDQNPSPKETLAPSLPDANRVDLGLGVGYTYKWMSFDLGYLMVYFLPSESTTGEEGPVGTYNSIAHLMGLSFTGRFGGSKKTVDPELVRQ